MVKISYIDIDEIFNDIKVNASNRQACTIMIMVANEVDAMSSARMLTQLFRMESIAYVMRPVSTIYHVKQVYEYCLTSDIKSIILFNCGALYNIPKLFGLEYGGDERVFILDNHRPIHLANIYSRHNIVVFEDGLIPDNVISTDYPSDGSELSADNDTDDDSDSEEERIDNFFEDDDDAASEEDEEAELEESNELPDNDEIEIASVAATENQIEELDEQSNDADDENDAEDDDSTVEDINEESQLSKKRSRTEFIESGTDSQKDNRIVDEENSENVDRGQSDNEAPEDDEIRIVGRRRKIVDPKKERKHKLRHYYGQNATFTAPTALMMLELVNGKYGSHIPLDILWQAILGITDQYLRQNITEKVYDDCCSHIKSNLENHLLTSSERSRYIAYSSDFDNNRTNANSNSNSFDRVETVVNGSDSGNITENSDFRFFMYRHWSLFDAMYYSSYMACKLRVWTSLGESKLKDLLAKIGLPYQHSLQSFNFIVPHLKQHFRREIVNHKEEYGLVKPDVMFRTFARFNSFKNPVAASDVVLAACALIEMSFNSPSAVASVNLSTPGSKTTDSNNITPVSAATSHDSPSQDIEDAFDDPDRQDYKYKNEILIDASLQASRLRAFNEAYDCLGMKSEEVLRKGINAAIELQKILVRKASVLLESDDIQRQGRLYYCIINSNQQAARTRGSTDNQLFSLSGSSSIHGFSSGNINEIDEPFARPKMLTRLGQYIMDVKKSIPAREGGWHGKNLLPLILLSQKRSNYIIVGISPLSTLSPSEVDENSIKRLITLTNFKTCFQSAAKLAQAQFWNESFDTNIVEIHSDYVQDFLGELNFFMKEATKAK